MYIPDGSDRKLRALYKKARITAEFASYDAGIYPSEHASEIAHEAWGRVAGIRQAGEVLGITVDFIEAQKKGA